jgi:hypothetical protein
MGESVMKKMIITEAWLLDNEGNRVMRLTVLDGHTIPNLVDKESVRGGNFEDEEK